MTLSAPMPAAWKSLPRLLLALAGCWSCTSAGAMQPAAAAPLPTAWTLVWSDEFDGNAGSAPSSAIWNSEVGNAETGGWGNKELEYYTAAPRNAALDGQGHLVISAEKSADAGPCWNTSRCDYTSARITTAGKVTFTYGKIEARIQFPGGEGIWPAFWLLGDTNDWPECGEVDIMEYIGKTPMAVYGTAHGPGYSAGQSIGKPLDSATPWAGGWHTYTLIKQPDLMVWLADGVEVHRLTPASLPAGTRWAFERKFYVILNLAVGGNWPGSPDANTVFPARMKVDWVRIYKAQ